MIGMFIYKITNLLNEKIYVGQTKQPIEKRFIQHSKADSPLGQSMRDCGLENFTIEIVERCTNQTELNEREKFWIKVLKRKSPNGYNLSNGGAGSFITKNFFDEPIAEISLSMSKIKDLRMARGWTQEELGKMLSVQKAAVSKYEREVATPSNEVLKKMSAIFHVSTDYLLDNKISSDAPVYHLEVEETRLIDGYRALDKTNKNLIMNLIGQLNVARASVPTTTLAM